MPSIKDLSEKIKPFYTILLCAVIASIFFALGRLSAIEERHQPVKVITAPDMGTDALPGMEDGSTSGTTTASGDQPYVMTAAAAAVDLPNATQGGSVVGSKTGKKYYLPWCGGLKRVKPENRVPFDSIQAARAAGYTPAGNCKGVQ